MAVCEQCRLEHTSSCMIGSVFALLNNEPLVNIRHKDWPELTNACVAILTVLSGKKKQNMPDMQEKDEAHVFYSRMCVRKSCALLAALLCPTCRGSSRVLTAPVMLLLLALTCGSMWGLCRSTQQHRQEGDLLSSQMNVLWRRVGEAVCLPHLPQPSFSCAIADFLLCFFYHWGQKRTTADKATALLVYSTVTCHLSVCIHHLINSL